MQYGGIRSRICAVAFLLATLTSCGGGGGNDGSGSGLPPGSGTPPPVTPVTPTTPAPTANAISLQSAPGDPIGLGKSYGYASTNSTITTALVNGRLSISVAGDESWTADFVLPATQTALTVGTYTGLSNLPVRDPAAGAFRWFGEGRGCGTSTATVTIDQVTYADTLLSSYILHFERYCDGAATPLRGEVRWTRADTSQPAAVGPPPPGLWAPDPLSVPASGNYVVLQSDPGDVVGLGKTLLYTDIDNAIFVGGSASQVYVQVDGDGQWSGTFQAMDAVQRLAAGYYFPNLKGMPFYNPVRGGLAWVGEGRGCVSLRGWFVIDRVAYNATGQYSGIDLRFEQACDGSNAVLRGAVHWDARPDPSTLPPATLSTAGSWHAPTAALPSSGNYLYLSSEAGDFVGAGRTKLNTSLDSVFAVQAIGPQLSVDVKTGFASQGLFIAPTGQSELQAGVYGGLMGLNQLNPPPLGTLSWFQSGRSCGATVQGWLAIDSIAYSAGLLTAIDLRFEQVCGNAPGTLKGQLHWRADETQGPPGPVMPVPAALWQPSPGTTPAIGNYVHLEADRGDSIGLGIAANYTQTNSVLKLTPTGAGLVIDIAGDEKWTARLQPMAGLTQLQPGYYAGVNEIDVRNPAKGGFDFQGEGRGCNTAVSSYAIDNVAYANGALTALDMRFEQHCQGTLVAATRGSVHWTNTDPSVPPGPIQPPPADLWKPAPGATPDTGSYVYLQSDPGDFIGDGQTVMLAAPVSPMTIGATFNGALEITVGGPIPQLGDLAVMTSRTRLEPGYYGRLQRYPNHNPARGGLSWSSQLRGCNTLSGWFVVDSVSYAGETLMSIDLRFEQHCEGLAPALHGRVRWQR